MFCVYLKKKRNVSAHEIIKANLKNINVIPYLTLFYRYGSVRFFFFTSQIQYPLNLNVNSPNIGNKNKYTNNSKIDENLCKQGKFDEFISPDEGLFERNM